MYLLKYVELRRNPSLEFSMMMVFTYLPYALAEGIHLSGIMAILFCGIVMSHYTHYNLSPITQITMKQTMRTIAFIAGITISSICFQVFESSNSDFFKQKRQYLLIWAWVFLVSLIALSLHLSFGVFFSAC